MNALVRERERWADILKGIGAILVVIGHLVLYEGYAKIYIYSFHMPLFFFISGYLYHQEKNFKTFLKRKVKNLLVPYFLFAFISILVTYFLEGIYLSKSEILATYFFVNGSFAFNSSLWFLIIMFFTLIFFYIIRKSIKIEKPIFALITTIILLVICVFLNIKQIKLYFGLEIVPHALLVFYLGYLYKLNKVKINKVINKVLHNNIVFIFQVCILLIISFYLSLLNGRVNMSTSIYNNYFLYLVAAIISIYVYVLISKKLELCKNKFNTKFADVLVRFSFLSLLMFCTQRLIFKVYYKIQDAINIDLMSGKNIIVTIFMIILTLLIYYLYDRIKYIITRRLNYEKT